MPWNGAKPSYGNGECGAAFLAKGPQKCWDLLEFGWALAAWEGIRLGSKPDYDNQLSTDCLGHTQCTKQYRSTDVKVWDNTTTRTLSFGKETADQAIQQGSARVNNGMQQDIGELATQTFPPSATIYQEIQQQAMNPGCLQQEHSECSTDQSTQTQTSYLPRECRAAFREKVSESTGIHGVVGIVGRNPRRINATGCKLDLKSPESMASQGIHGVSPVGHYNDSAEKYCWNQICPKYLTNHGSVTANGLTGLVDLLYGLERKPLELKHLNSTTRASSDRLNRTSQRYSDEYTASIEYVSLIGLQNQALYSPGILARFRHIDFRQYRHCITNTSTEHADRSYTADTSVEKEALQVPGVLARFRGINFNGYRHCVYPNTPIEAIRNPARQHQSSDVKVGENPRARTLSFGMKSKSTQSSKAVHGLTTECSKTLAN
ncbi:hypothetical protein R3P38DRAFT_2804952 [Favolaschia claudopus]|uniref:Uncharacterized protein n=1 Tax=Favolaschia claudopus TaxID=2862362 RepID=A0AAV9ZPH4_9AGAR